MNIMHTYDRLSSNNISRWGSYLPNSFKKLQGYTNLVITAVNETFSVSVQDNAINDSLLTFQLKIYIHYDAIK